MNDITNKVLSGMSGDGFNERKGYINRNNDLNNMNKNPHFDESLAQMRIAENKPDIKTANDNKIITNKDMENVDILKRNIDMYKNRIKQNFK